MISLEGLASGDEERALAYIKVTTNGQTYDWQTFIPPGQGHDAYLSEAESKIKADIAAKEAAWAALTPKTREIEDPMTGEKRTVDIDKSEIVRPDIPDYYAKRRAEYPSVAEQMGAMWKGGQAQADMAAKIQAVKDKYPKP